MLNMQKRRISKDRLYNVHLVETCEAVIDLDSKITARQQRAVESLRKLALKSDEAMILLAHCYACGLGTIQNQTVTQIMLSICHDHEEAQLHLNYLKDKVKLGL